MKRMSYLQWVDAVVKCIRRRAGDQFDTCWLWMPREMLSEAYDSGLMPSSAANRVVGYKERTLGV